MRHYVETKFGSLRSKLMPLVCLVKKHYPITVIEKMEIEDVSEGPYGMSVRGRVTEKSKKCQRCRKRL